ncbi:3-hydroxyacyl-[acyl-carrier-protein] dehydratase FabZ [Bordetella genomosp. 10]|uniref:3-hydroxyacyl-[acyl-carrier-protein] dehydratase FabZ n=1 Tax=Bordetella genomosp. 10 TaxID=1416804 RepID=A0A261S6K8_9BORD|nr:3-hydroxyacyl-ACP dehydratase FabZ [Bordetella genomosp. 10]OZI32430.1 3-hydroxyacyl-[acyl-carrier-protein] dehydratase FabZ [Bordetella genomosp. 10]
MNLSIDEILQKLPHRFPMLLIDRVLELVSRKRIVAIKNVSRNEPFFQNTPAALAIPPTLVIEAMAQAAALFSFADSGDGSRPEHDKSVYYFLGIDKAKFVRDVVPGDQLRIEVEALRLSRAICKYRGNSFVDGELAVSAEILCAVRSSVVARK